MTMLIKNGRIIDPCNKIDSTGDLLISGGKIIRVGGQINENADITIDADGLWVVPGLIDLHTHFRDPGYEHKEDIFTGARAAAKGGFTTVCCMANTNPIVDNADTVSYIVDKARNAIVNILQVGSITKGLLGKELSDFESMKAAGICAVSEDGKSVADSSLMLDGMLEAKRLNLPVFDHCEDMPLASDNDLQRSKLSEELFVSRAIALAIAAGVRLHLCHLSTAGSIESLRRANQVTDLITGEAAPHHFSMVFEEDMDANRKMNPPLRTAEDVKAIKNALANGTIDVIATDHAPHAVYEKKDYSTAMNGVIGLETALAVTITELGELLTPSNIIEKLSFNPAQILGISKGRLTAGCDADITIIDPNVEYVISGEFESKSKNSPFVGKKVKGAAVYTIVNGKTVMKEGKLI